MKRFLLFALSIMLTSALKAQDTIVLRDASEIQAKVTSVTQSEVTYKRWSNQEGPTYTIDKSKIFYIKYQNGEKDVMSMGTSMSSRSKTVTPIKFQGFATIGTIFTAEGAGPTLDITFGTKIYEHFYIGVETGFYTCFTPYEYYSGWDIYSGTAFEAYVPLGVNLKGYFTRGRKVNPYINCSLGGFFGVADLGGLNGFHCQVGLGLDIKRFNISMGYGGLVKYGTASMGYLKLGVRFGK